MQRTQTPNPNAEPLQSLEFGEGTDRAYSAVFRAYALRTYAGLGQAHRDASIGHVPVGVRPSDVFPDVARLALERYAKSNPATLPSFPSAKWGRPSPLRSQTCEFLPKYAASFKAVDSGHLDESALASAQTGWLPTPLASRPSAPADRCRPPSKKRRWKWSTGQSSRSTKSKTGTSRNTENYRKLEFRELMATIGIPLPPGIATSKK